MSGHRLLCPHCGIALGRKSPKTDKRGRPYARLTLNANAPHAGWTDKRGDKYVECQCGEKVRLPDGFEVVFPVAA